MSISNFFIMRELDKKMQDYDKYGIKEMIEEYRRLIKHAAYFKYTSLQYAYLAYMDAKDILKMKMMRLSKLYPETRDINIFKKDKITVFGDNTSDIFRKTINNKFFSILILKIDRDKVYFKYKKER